MKDKILAFESTLTRIIWIVCSIAVIGATLLVFTITVARYGFGISWEWAEELSRYCIVFAALLGSAPMVFKETHICMDLLVKNFKSHRLVLGHKIFSACCSLIISILLFAFGLRLVLVTNVRSYSLIFDMQAIYMILPFSMAIMVLYSILKIITVICTLREESKEGVSNVWQH